MNTKPKKNKYRNVPQVVDGEKYRSKKEMRRHQELLLLARAGKIHLLQREVPIVLAPSVVIQGRKRPALRYIADFVYFLADELTQTYEDAKGVRTEGYRIKRHLMKSVHNIDILES